MARKITYYFSLLSPWAYIGHAAFMDIVRRRGVTLDYRPVNLMQVFPETGGQPLPKRHPARQRYRLLELQRWREKRALNFDLHPKYWPFDVGLADRSTIALLQSGNDPDAFLRSGFAAVWEKGANLADERALQAIAAEVGLDGTAMVAAAKSQSAISQYETNVGDAIAADAFGSPVYILDGEVFWGQDRLDLLDDALASGRKPYAAAA